MALPAVRGTAVRGVADTLRPLVGFAAAALAILLLSRLGLLWLYGERVAVAGDVGAILALGFRFDLIVTAVVCSIPLLANIVLPGAALRTAPWRRVFTLWLSAWLMLIVFNEAATPAFMAEFGVRPNRQYVEYLGTPEVVLATIWQDNRTSVLLGCALTLALGVAMSRWLGRVGRSTGNHVSWTRVLVLLPLLVLAAYGARGSFGHRPLSVSNAALTTDPTVNDLALNSTYSAAYAVRQLVHERKAIRGYGQLDDGDMLERVRAGMQLPSGAFADPARPTHHVLTPTTQSPRPPNLVVIVEESLGAQYFASLGGLPIARELDRWRTRSFWFDQLYATGTRSARGIEAVVTGFLPTRTSSIIKLEGAQRNFFTLGSALKAQGYHTRFIYGGDASFDNMRRFLLGNGFDEIVDQSDLKPEARFATTWGVSDEDLFKRVHAEALQQHQAEEPYFTLVFTTSNHPPYDFPDGVIELYELPKQTHRNAARYADHAAAAYLDRAAKSPYWGNTVFLVVADHEGRTVGRQLVPIFSFHIPAFITGGPVEPRIIQRLASQIDLLPTTLSLMGQAVALPATGLDQSRSDLTGPGQAVMQFQDHMALRVGDRVAILAPHQPVRQFSIQGQELRPVAGDADFARDALAQALLPIRAYREGWYR